MNTPFDLPEGVTWREVTDADVSWLSSMGHHLGGGTVSPDQRGIIESFAAISIRVTIRHPDGREREFVDGWYPFRMDGETREALIGAIAYQWLDGNFGCDCNRSLFFARAGQEDHLPGGVCGRLYRLVAPAWLANAGASDTEAS